MRKSFKLKHQVILVDHQTNTEKLVDDILKGQSKGLAIRLPIKTGVFAQYKIDAFINEEHRHDLKILTRNTAQALKTMSSGERKKILLNHLLEQELDCMILVNPYDNLDIQTQTALKEKFDKLGESIFLIQILTRAADVLPNTTLFYGYKKEKISKYPNIESLLKSHTSTIKFKQTIPRPLKPFKLADDTLVQLKDVSVNFEEKQVLNSINWTVVKGDFWQLVGPNGSGKTTILNMITGDSPKSYGQNVTLFGHKKGSGESVWDIKQLIGYFTPAMTDRFRGYHTLENMLISGLHDSIGLYQKPTDIEKSISQKWLQLLRLEAKKNHYFHQLSMGEKRLLMTARGMIKHPPLLILDEPTTGLDDASAHFFVSLVNKFAQESTSAIIFVSHRKETGLKASKTFALTISPKGSSGAVCIHS